MFSAMFVETSTQVMTRASFTRQAAELPEPPKGGFFVPKNRARFARGKGGDKSLKNFARGFPPRAPPTSKPSDVATSRGVYNPNVKVAAN